MVTYIANVTIISSDHIDMKKRGGGFWVYYNRVWASRKKGNTKVKKNTV